MIVVMVKVNSGDSGGGGEGRDSGDGGDARSRILFDWLEWSVSDDKLFVCSYERVHDRCRKLQINCMNSY